MALATVEDVEIRLGRELPEAERDQVTALLDDAELILRNRIPTLLDKADEDELFRDTVVLVESRMVMRVIRNPDGYTQETDGNYSYTINGRVASGLLETLPDEWALLGASAGMFMIKPVVEVIQNREPVFWYDWRYNL